MKPPLFSPPKTGMERSALGLAGAIVALGAMTLTGWWLHIDEFLQPIGVFAPLTINAAIAFCLVAVTVILTELHDRRLGLIATLPLLVGLISLAELGQWAPAGFGEWFGEDRFSGGSAHAGRMSAGEALSLVLASGVLLWRVNAGAENGRRCAQALVGSLLLSSGASALLGYTADLPALHTWSEGPPVPPLAAALLLLQGLVFLLLAWHESIRADDDAPSWSPLPVVIVCLTLTIVLWVGLRAREQAYTTQTTQAQLELFATVSTEALEKQTAGFERIARLWSDSPASAISLWEADATRRMEEDSAELGCVAIAYVDPAFRATWNHPRPPTSSFRTLDHGAVPARRAALEKAASGRGRPAISGTTLVPGQPGPENGFVIYAPVLRAGEAIGFVAADFSYQAFFRAIVTSKAKLHGYSVSVAIDGEPVYASAAAGRGNRALTLHRTAVFAQRRLKLTLTPTDAALAQNRRYLSESALAAGIGISLLLGLSVHLARSGRSGQRAAELLNKRLFAENEERRRIEGRLKVSDERLRLALDSTQTGIFEWNVSSGYVFYSPGMWTMFGYEAARMPSTLEAWQSLIHPEDQAAYRRRIESQLAGIISFIEPEYRVRARNGDWRWVCMRSKSVAANSQGRATRIIGTVQDVTPRHDAEAALRESQYEARKLSLVAAKTDSPVLIGSPDGRIEWVNEAFCRVMEYQLSEVIGKNPAHFMIGPETNLRTVARIRAAMARGQGISTDVVNYSKSGRKFHLHVEIQPVRGANGELENFIAVETDITSRVETEQQLRRAKAEADDASRAKSEFLASMSHEIRTPMNGVIGMTSLLLETPLNVEQRDYVGTIRNSGEALLTIINDILDFSKIESGKMELDRSPFELSLCLEEALDLFVLQAAAKKIEIGYHISTDVPAWIVGDVTRLRQVVVNLVNNAVKFTPSGSVSVEVRRASRPPPPAGFAPVFETDPARLTLEFTVRDTGIGIPAARADRLFKAFSQVDSSTTRKYGGTGLGLAISRQLCQLMGGEIRVESAVGQGTSFIFTIETAAAPANSSSGLSTTPEPLRGGWVLCVEDNPTTQGRLKALVENWGVECVVVPDAAAALSTVARRPRAPALLVLDTGEPEEGPRPLDALTSIKCPRMLLVPFGQTPPESTDGQPCANTTKPIRTIPFVLAVVGLFQSVARGAKGDTTLPERPIGEEIPLEVLLAEDNAVNQKVALRFLERLGYRADAVANGLEAVTTLQNRRYDLVLMDLQMPEMDGFEATRQIRHRLPSSRQPKIVALTANAMHGDRELCFASGMDDYISKPVKIHEIAEAIRRHFAPPEKAGRAPHLIS